MIVIRIMGEALGRKTMADGQYIRSMDFEAHDGRGELKTTADRDKAKKFADLVEAWEFWKTSPKCHPVRLSDGRPNRPLTAYTVTMEPVE